eukprot:TRINITY_DN2124_c0_g1_i5.p1 TRINITY_DN2124_c0_g1~~TRINITY_DN2124_c0_g1_i5.p1  ORF type:complete len:333 (+),score=42.39 TRINITY_DN2124_c0_g1_i5:88-999(+)
MKDDPDKKDAPERKSGKSGDSLILDAQQLLKWAWCPCFPETRYEDASERYKQAGLAFKRDQSWQKSTESYRKAYELSLKAKDKTEAMSNIGQAAFSAKKYDSSVSISLYHIAADLCMECGNHAAAAKHYHEIALLEEQAGRNKAAIQAFNEAARYHKEQDSQGTSDNMNLKIADLHALEKEYKEAIKNYEEVAKRDAESSLRRWSVKDTLFKALLCHHLACGTADVIESTDKLETALGEYFDISPAFRDTREAKLIQNLVDAIRGDPTSFEPKAKDYVKMINPAKPALTLLNQVVQSLVPDHT